MTGFVNALPTTITPIPHQRHRDRRAHPARATPLPQVHPSAVLVEDLALPAELAQFAATLDEAWQPVSITGMSGNYTPGDRIGSWRASLYDPGYAEVLFARLRPLLVPVKTLCPLTGTSEETSSQWQPIGVNPLLRLVRYEHGGMLVPHYDGPYVADDQVRTLTSVVLYVYRGDGVTGGATRFLRDDYGHLPVDQRPLADRTGWQPEPADVIFHARPQPGDALLFDHRILHDSELVTGGTKLICRTDVLYRRLP